MRKYYLATIAICLLVVSVSAQQKKKSNTAKALKAQSKRAPIDTTRFVLVGGGTFNMGTDKFVEAIENPPHSVTVNSFWLAKTETTFEDYDKFCFETKRDTMGSAGWGRGRQPAIYVSWNDAIAYCNWLSGKEKLSKCYLIDSLGGVKYLDTAKGYRLPTEAEWEFAARGGNKGQGFTHSGSNNIDEVAWYNVNSGGKAHPVAQKKPNELGLYDMDGNVWEWLWDIFDGSYYRNSPSDNPQGPATGPYRVMRGGAFYNNTNYAKVFTRQNSYVVFRQNSVGFRIARTYY
jgi:formylglycine-generating enzyme required for sulfatase activity